MSAAAVISIRIKRVFALLRAQGALSPESAVPESDVPYSKKWYFRRLVSQGAVRRIGDMCYLDEACAQEYLRARRTRALVFLAVAILAFCLYLLISQALK